MSTLTLTQAYQKLVALWVAETQPEGAGIIRFNDYVGYYTDPAQPPAKTFTRLGETWEAAAQTLGLTLQDT